MVISQILVPVAPEWSRLEGALQNFVATLTSIKSWTFLQDWRALKFRILDFSFLYEPTKDKAHSQEDYVPVELSPTIIIFL